MFGIIGSTVQEYEAGGIKELFEKINNFGDV